MKELSSWDWSEVTILGCLGISEFWTISDWTELGLVGLSVSSFLSAVTSFALFSFLLHDTTTWHVYGFHVHGNHCDLFCSFVKGCACIDSWIWIEFAVCHKFALFLFCLRHWSLVDHILPVKMCGTHLGVVVSVIFVGSVNHLLRCASRTLGWTRENLCLAWHEMAEL